ncbi:interferon-induced guanylate-binding protein, putative [Perkinsus marinus ATCC 50983]|uniref:Interferon-induced guanylate-binding protein, putative n=1 Tax=Perkinsus marinus (strain ATCC 50983 / TXsc) TaxID=423536 RepID=C5KJ30_PERM5|nr:interferon-induced guanylate-binding protein, putative [Perkinsus marinus ATCC 50983]EER15512.1 interferon-induced guanylate-binding protein, putative [Perkinsus marinus ATCC 50983]|eukprot:XP_002783716.1 interferon-induced guanylate-binding protein, putative [Perkinsus marinus ATCC 50983]
MLANNSSCFQLWNTSVYAPFCNIGKAAHELSIAFYMSQHWKLLRLLLFVFLATVTGAVAEKQDARGQPKPDKFPFFVPVQVVKPSKDHNNLQVVPESINLLRSASQRRPISVISVVGPYHSGKSFLLNSLLQKPSTFSVGPKTSPQTLGIWMCRTDLSAPDGSEIWLMDSEGFFGPQVTETYDAKIFTVATLLGSHLVYNTVKVIDQQAVNLLEMLARRAQLFRVRSLAPSAVAEDHEESIAEASAAEIPVFLSAKTFPPLTWVVEDFVQDMAASQTGAGASTMTNDSAIATEWLKS